VPAAASALVYPKPAARLRAGSRVLRGPQQPNWSDCPTQDPFTPVATGQLTRRRSTLWPSAAAWV